VTRHGHRRIVSERHGYPLATIPFKSKRIFIKKSRPPRYGNMILVGTRDVRTQSARAQSARARA
jgi:hypothetical protein